MGNHERFLKMGVMYSHPYLKLITMALVGGMGLDGKGSDHRREG